MKHFAPVKCIYGLAAAAASKSLHINSLLLPTYPLVPSLHSLTKIAI